MTGGSPIDGHVPDHIVLLREMKKLRRESGTPSPTKYDLWTLAAVFDLLGRIPPKTRYAKAADELKAAKLRPVSNIYAYRSLLESLAFIGVLATEEHPGMVSAFTTYRGVTNARIFA
jgi:hypothetical protein